MGILEGIIGPLLQKYLGAYFEGTKRGLPLANGPLYLSRIRTSFAPFSDLDASIRFKFA
jgi:hypothetical protein